jgi:hypothetical protein
MRILRVGMLAATGAIADLSHFYQSLDLLHRSSSNIVELYVGETVIQFSPFTGEDAPFYHYAIRVPRNRFEAAAEWLGKRTPLLPDPGSGTIRFEYENWKATSCYAHDPAGNIVEIIAHRELPEESLRTGAFSGREALGVCEVGLVSDDTRKMAQALQVAGLHLWDGSLQRGRLAFMGAGGDGLLILAPTGRGWLPTGRPAVPYPVDVDVDIGGERAQESEILIPYPGHRVRIATISSTAGQA